MIIVGTLVGILAGFFIGVGYRKKVAEREIGSAEAEATRLINEAIRSGENRKKEMLLEAKDEIHKSRTEYEKEVKERRAELSKQERRLEQKEASLDKKTENFERKEEELAKKLAAVAETQAEAERIRKQHLVTLETISGLTQEEAAGRVGKSRPAVANALRLLGLCPEVLERLRKGELTAGHARAILSLKSEKKQQEAAQKIVALGLSVRQAELICKNMSREPAPEKEVTLAVDYVAECEKSLSKHLGRGVKIVNGKRKGRFELEFYGQDDLQTLLDALMQIRK